jgi:hypothetical protein
MPFNASQKAVFDKLYAGAVNAEQTRLVQMKDEMIDLMLMSGEATEQYMDCKSVVPHLKNRGGSKMQWFKIFSKGSAIVKVGVSLDECGPKKAVCFQENPLTKCSANAYIKLCKTSEHYPRFTDPEVVDGCSVGCGHWNQFLCCIRDKVIVPVQFRKPHLVEPDGSPHLDADRLCKDQPALAHLLKNGLKFTRIKHSMQVAYPQLPNIFQKPLNVEHHIGEGAVSTNVFYLCFICAVTFNSLVSSHHPSQATSSMSSSEALYIGNIKLNQKNHIFRHRDL